MEAALSHDLRDLATRSSCPGQISLEQMATVLTAALSCVDDMGLKLN